jgi:hypothetical protein
MNNIPGFASAQRAYENMEPAAGCDCPQLFQCQFCDEVTSEPVNGDQCPDKQCQEDNRENHGKVSLVVPIDREDSQIDAESGCSLHGWCTGCTSRNCEDCGGDYEPDYDD